MGFFISTLHNKISSQFNNCLICKVRVSIMISATAAKRYEKTCDSCNMCDGVGAPLPLMGFVAYIPNGGKCHISGRCL